jgi:transposase
VLNRLNRHDLTDEEWDRLRGFRAYLRKRGITAVIPVKEDQKKHRRARGRAGGRPPAFDAGRYKERNTVERCFAKLRQFRAIATRYDKREFMYQGTVDVASIGIWLADGWFAPTRSRHRHGGRSRSV